MRIFTLSITLLILLVACQENQKSSNEITTEDIALIKPVGDQIAKNLVKSLQKELKAAIEEGGFDEAVRVCNLEAIPISEIIAASSENNIEIKRTSHKYRNPDNAPNEYETNALNHFEELIADGKAIPEYYMQKYFEQEKTIYYYYKPMTVGSKCLSCHGNESTVPPQTKQMIDKFYPEDKAIDYEEGDFRGLIRIKITEQN